MSRNYFLKYPITWGVVVIILYLSLSRIPSTPMDDIPSIDKFVHTGMYAFLSAIIWFERSRQHRAVKLSHAFAGAFLLPVIMGGSLELIQEYGTDCRQGSWWDFAANTLGVVIIWLAVWPQRRRISL